VFDAKGPTFRDSLYPAYKAQRSAMPADLALQIEPIVQAVKLLGWPVLSVPGIEADDAIGTLCAAAVRAGFEVVVSTGDKDLAQLVNDHVTLINTMSNERLDAAAVLAKFGVPPQRIVDYLSLVGDTVDNVPGVEKVGPKTAAQMDRRARVFGRRDRVGGVHQGCGRREPAPRAGLAADGPAAGDGAHRRRPECAGAGLAGI